ncbi:MAG: SUMF1/EgtB/PvdO family nonheme iron enzyme, partial [bacterium]
GRRKEARDILGSLDKKQWPELANIEIELAARARRGLSPPKTLSETPAPPAKKEESKQARATKPAGEVKPAAEAKEPEKMKAPMAKRAETKKPSAPALAAARHPHPRRRRRLTPRKPSYANMVAIPGGTFLMGRPARGRNKRNSERGVRVDVRPFRLDKFEVTNARYGEFVREAGYPEPPFWRRPHFAGPHLPVVGVAWSEASAYCAWAGKRLPTEEEWEFAARGGAEGRRYPWGDEFVERNAVFGLSPTLGGPKAVGRRAGGASLHGVEDLAGNAWEWVEDPFRPDLKEIAVARGEGAPLRTLRGGSWVNGRRGMEASSRTGDLPGRRLPVYGVRCEAGAR